MYIYICVLYIYTDDMCMIYIYIYDICIFIYTYICNIYIYLYIHIHDYITHVYIIYVYHKYISISYIYYIVYIYNHMTMSGCCCHFVLMFLCIFGIILPNWQNVFFLRWDASALTAGSKRAAARHHFLPWDATVRSILTTPNIDVVLIHHF